MSIEHKPGILLSPSHTSEYLKKVISCFPLELQHQVTLGIIQRLYFAPYDDDTPNEVIFFDTESVTSVLSYLQSQGSTSEKVSLPTAVDTILYFIGLQFNTIAMNTENSLYAFADGYLSPASRDIAIPTFIQMQQALNFFQELFRDQNFSLETKGYRTNVVATLARLSPAFHRVMACGHKDPEFLAAAQQLQQAIAQFLAVK